MIHRSNYTHRVHPTLGVVLVEDQLGAKSVTNDAADVVKDIVAKGHTFPDPDLILYRDSEGVWDAMLVKGGQFDSFVTLTARTEDAAIQLYKRWLTDPSEFGHAGHR